MGALAAIIAIRNNNNIRSRRNHFSKDIMSRSDKNKKPIYNSISKVDLKKLRRKLQIEQSQLQRKKYTAIFIIDLLTTIIVGSILFL